MSQIDLGPNRQARPAPLDVVVQRVERTSGGFIRVTFGGPALKSFVWPGPASHLKFFPVFETTDRGELRQEDAAGSRPLSRTYTPRSFDARAHELVIDFLLHGDGPAALWASRAQPGVRARVSVPRASYRLAPDMEWALLCADDSGLPGLATILDAGVHVPTRAIIETNSEEFDRPRLDDTRLDSLTWVTSDQEHPGAALQAAISAWTVPAGIGSVWVACEASAVRGIRGDLLVGRGLSRDHVITRGYWSRGAANHPDHDYGE